MRSTYDPFNRDEELQEERSAALREEHEAWSLEQARRGNDAAHRENAGTWIRIAPPLDQPPTRTLTGQQIHAPRS